MTICNLTNFRRIFPSLFFHSRRLTTTYPKTTTFGHKAHGIHDFWTIYRPFSLSSMSASAGGGVRRYSISIPTEEKPLKLFSRWFDYDLLMDENSNEAFKYFCNQIFGYKEFRFLTVYGLVIKIKISGGQYYTLFKGQRQICLKDSNDLKHLEILYNEIVLRGNEILDLQYPELINEYPEAFTIAFFSLKAFNSHEFMNYIKNVSQLAEIKDSVRVKAIKRSFAFLGGYSSGMRIFDAFETNIFEGRFIPNLHWDISKGMLHGLPSHDFEEFDHKIFYSFIRKANIKIEDPSTLRAFVKSIRGKWFVILIHRTGELSLKRFVFNSLGNLISEISDIFIKDYQSFYNYRKKKSDFPFVPLLDYGLNEGILIRRSGDMIQIFDQKDNLIYMSKNYAFKPIAIVNKRLLFNTYYLPDLSFGTMDLETYKDEADSINYVYCLGYYIPNEKILEKFYIDKDMDSSKLVHTCFEKLLKGNYAKRRLYIHNLGGYDAYFIIKSLAMYNENVLKPLGENLYYMENLNRNDDFIKLVVKRHINGKVRSVTLCDSFAYLSCSLASLGKSYGLSITKGDFPHGFVNKRTLFYRGVSPSRDYFPNMQEDSKIIQDWDLKMECLKYLELDLKSLYEVLSIVARRFHILFNEQITDSLTISALSMKYFMKNHYNQNKNPLPLIRNKKVFSDISMANYGARTEVFKPYGKDLFYYDVNSLYPYSSLNTLCGINAKYIEFVKPLIGLSEDVFGFFYCKIDTSKSWIQEFGLLPKRDKKGSLLFPLGVWCDWYNSEELKFVLEYGYEIVVYKGYNFDKAFNVFDSFINKVNKYKTEATEKSDRNVSKLVMNSNIGKYSMNPFKERSDLVSQKELFFILARYIVSKQVKITEDLYYVSYVKVLDKETCIKSGLDYINELNTLKVDEDRGQKRSDIDFESISTGAAILSYARIYMAKAMIYVIQNGGTLYYTDTDSLVIDIKLPEYMTDPQKLGLFKLEVEVKEGYFLADKVYAIKPKNWDGKENSIIKKAKGILSGKLEYNDYIKMYNQGRFDFGTKVSSKKNLAMGNVNIETKTDIKLNLVYTKRYKIYSNGKWIDTSTRVLDRSLSLALTLYISPNLSLIVWPKENYLNKDLHYEYNNPPSLRLKTLKLGLRFYTTLPRRGSWEDSLNKAGISLNPDFEKYNALTPFKQTNLLAPLFITKSLIYSMENANKCLNKLSDNNLVKKFLLKELEGKIRNTARLGKDGANILKTVKLTETYISKGAFAQSFANIRYSEINFSSYRSNIFRLNKIYKSLHGRFENDKLLIVSDGKKPEKYDACWSGCYVIYLKKSLYYYIGYSSMIPQRLSKHVSDIKSFAGWGKRQGISLPMTNKLRDQGFDDCFYTPLEFYLASCIKNKHEFEISMGPICLSKNFKKIFQSKYPDYKLSVGEYLILTYYTDLIGKIMEQSLITHYNPLLNGLKKAAVKNICLDDKYLSIPYTKTYKPAKVRYLIKTGISYQLSLKSELYLVQVFNLEIEEVLANLGKLHYYKNSRGIYPYLIITRVEI